MSYGLRNTLILLAVLLLLAGGGISYIYYGQLPEIEELESELSEKETELQEKQQIADQYPALLKSFEEARDYINNYDKALYVSSDEDNVYDFVNRINSGSSFTDFTFTFSDSTSYDEYGTMAMQITGSGYYRNVMNFIRQIELNSPINKVRDVTISPINEEDSYGQVNFDFSLESFYDRMDVLDDPQMTVANNLVGTLHNPFYPLIRSVQANEDNLVDVEQSSLIAIGTRNIYLLDQDGMLQKMSTGDEVYLGELSSYSVDQGTATFVLNKGGIIDRVTLQVNNDNEDN